MLTNGAQFYPAMRDAIRAAQESINLEAYILQPGDAADMLIDAMVDRARAGVEVRIVLDAIGSAGMGGAAARRLREAGCQLNFYQPIRWYRLHRLNNRTHRELLVVDGGVAFTGGAGIADWWLKPRQADGRLARHDGAHRGAGRRGDAGRVRRELARVLRRDPDVVPALADARAAAAPAQAMLVKSSPSDRATASRVVFQMLIEGAVTTIDISTPYFLPDRALRRALVRAARRGVRVRVIVPGRDTDQRLVRLASRRMYRELLDGGVRIHEYRPAMTHVKALMVDETWAMIGTTNVDNRSFEHNDEINVAFREQAVTSRLRRDFEADLAASDEVTLDRVAAAAGAGEDRRPGVLDPGASAMTGIGRQESGDSAGPGISLVPGPALFPDS